MVKKLNRESGFTLLEVLIAMTIFATFYAMYATSQSYNISDSMLMKEEVKLRELCERKMNEIVLDPPELKPSLEMSKDKETFKNDDNYEYEVTYKQLKIPDLSSIKEEEGQEDEGQESGIKKQIMETVSKNLEKLIWQVNVTVRNKTTDYNYELSTWLYNYAQKVDLGTFQQQ